MKLSAPKKNTFWIATIIAALGLVGRFAALPFVSQYAFFFILIAFVILWLSVTMKGF